MHLKACDDYMLVRLCKARYVLRPAETKVRAPDGAWSLRAGCSCGSLPRALDAALAPVRPWLRSDAMAACLHVPVITSTTLQSSTTLHCRLHTCSGLHGMLRALWAIKGIKRL